jgi:hypothetical protein
LAQKKDQIKVAANGGLYIARLEDEPTLPTDADTALDALFKEVGYVGDDGATFSKGEEVEDVMAWQSQDPVLKIVTGRNFGASCPLLQWNQDTVALGFGGGEWTEPKAGTYRFDPPANYDPLTEWVAVLETISGERTDRWVIKRGTVTGDIETNAVRNAPMTLPIEISALTPDGDSRAWYYVSNDPAFEAAS